MFIIIKSLKTAINESLWLRLLLTILDEEATAHKLENLLKLPPRWGDTVTPGSSAKLADGAAACVLMNENGLKR